MMDRLNFLRSEIDKIDQSLLNLLSKRLSLVSQVGEIKSQLGLFIYDPEREKMILSQRKQEALKLGISPNLVRDILRRIMRESYSYENEKGFKKLYPSSRPVVIIGGNGRMGQFFFKMLTLSGYQVRILDQDDWIHAKSILTNVGVVFISVPIYSVIKVINQLPHLSNDCIIVDLSSVKKSSLTAILKIHTGPVLGLHPMFSPDTTITASMIKKVVICCDGRYPQEYQWLLQQLKLWGAKVYYCNFIEHDKYMSFIQSLCHFTIFVMGYHLFKENIDLKKILSFSSPMFQLELILIGRLFTQNPQLYADIIMSSKNNIIVIKRYYKRLGKMLMLLEQNNKEEFINQFKKIKCWLDSYAGIFLKDSSNLLKYINDIQEY
ncbi:chorismate mutase/prephenate dehydrogenase [Candidatus Blochmanniella floridana]|uniref:T-protein n=1 Tax=Blochmanniella floridana TaxID=203907 RepID=Q7VQF6_BLOFL|nr:chorismate mutase/prephenate dehydrogenase [Candidatus Blochmannia floridanus]